MGLNYFHLVFGQREATNSSRLKQTGNGQNRSKEFASLNEAITESVLAWPPAVTTPYHVCCHLLTTTTTTYSVSIANLLRMQTAKYADPGMTAV